MHALLFILNALFTLVVVAFLLRVIMPLVRADFRNPIGEAVLKVTNPLVLPLRRALPPARRLDPAAIVALLLVQFLKTAVLMLVAGGGINVTGVLVGGLHGLVILVVQFYFYADPDVCAAELVRRRRAQPRGADPRAHLRAAAGADPARDPAARRARPLRAVPDDRPAGPADAAALTRRAEPMPVLRRAGADWLLDVRVQPRARADGIRRGDG